MNSLEYHLDGLPGRSFFAKTSALDEYYGLADSAVLDIYTESTLIDIAKTLTDVRYPGLDHADALIDAEDGDVVIRCVDSLDNPVKHPIPILNITYDPDRRAYKDPFNVYRVLRSKDFDPVDLQSWDEVADAAMVIARYGIGEDQFRFEPAPWMGTEFPELAQRHTIVRILEGKFAREGFRFLASCGFVDTFWPELAEMYTVGHSKEHHPEGDVWDHTTETFAYRKTTDLSLSLGLLFHDVGKPRATPQEGRRFDKHAEIGASMARRFLRRLDFDEKTIGEVNFLVRNHMLPPAISALPTFRTEEVMASPLFPVLLELYRCDLSSTYRGPDGYYKACKAYRAFLKHSKNPFRSSDGKKLLRLYVESGR